MKKKILSLLTAFAMVFGIIAAPFTSASAADAKTSDDPKAVTNTVTLHKLMMTKDELKAWKSEEIEEKGYDGTQDLAGLKAFLDTNHTAKEAGDVFFAWQVKGQKTFTEDGDNKGKAKYIKKDTTNEDKTVVKPALNENGELQFTADLDEAFGGLTKKGKGIKFDTSKLEGEFLIQEIKEKSTYSGEEYYKTSDKKHEKPLTKKIEEDGQVKYYDGQTEVQSNEVTTVKSKSIVDQKAVPVEITLPLVNKEGTVINAHVYPKNTEDKPQIDKNFEEDKGLKKVEGTEKATASVGDSVPYEVKTVIKEGTSYENLTWNDIMTNGLTYNEDLTITAEGITFENNTDYELVQDDAGFRLQLTPAGLKKIADITKATENPADVTITIQYSATVNGTAVVDKPEENNVTLEYGHKPGKDIEEKVVKSSNKELEVDKSFDTTLDETAKKDLVLAYTLKDGETVDGTVALTSADEQGKIFDLGNGIKFEVTGEFKGKFTGLDDTKDYTFSERVAGYNPEYGEIVAGKVTITNKKDNDNPPPIEPKTPEVVVGGKKFVKTNEQDERLEGAEFYVKNAQGQYLVPAAPADADSVKKAKDALDAAQKKYEGMDANAQKSEEGQKAKADFEAKQKAYNEAVYANAINYEFKNKENNKVPEGAVVLTSDKDGKFEITGLEYGKYVLEEKSAPAGYAKIADQEFTVGAGTYNGTAEEFKYEVKVADGETQTYGQQVKNKKVTIPQTGGIGSLIFIAAGLAIMGGAFVAYRKSQARA